MPCEVKNTGQRGRIVRRVFQNGIAWVLVAFMGAAGPYEKWHQAEEVIELPQAGQVGTHVLGTLGLPGHNHSEPPLRAIVTVSPHGVTNGASPPVSLGITTHEWKPWG